jgi:hypothetical protein
LNTKRVSRLNTKRVSHHPESIVTRCIEKLCRCIMGRGARCIEKLCPLHHGARGALHRKIMPAASWGARRAASKNYARCIMGRGARAARCIEKLCALQLRKIPHLNPSLAQSRAWHHPD